jgi:FtsH-binding integral membrane protein
MSVNPLFSFHNDFEKNNSPKKISKIEYAKKVKKKILQEIPTIIYLLCSMALIVATFCLYGCIASAFSIPIIMADTVMYIFLMIICLSTLLGIYCYFQYRFIEEMNKNKHKYYEV